MSHEIVEGWEARPGPVPSRGWDTRPQVAGRLRVPLTRRLTLADLPWLVAGGAHTVDVRADATGRVQAWQDGQPVGVPSAPWVPERVYFVTVTLAGAVDALTTTLTIDESTS